MGLKPTHSDGNRPVGIVSLTFDNLGEAAELELGAWPVGAPLGEHRTATEVVPELLGRLEQRGLAATFFVEGLNAELYPELLREIDARGHEVGYHAWRHEQWGELDTMAQIENLTRGLTGFAAIGLQLEGDAAAGRPARPRRRRPAARRDPALRLAGRGGRGVRVRPRPAPLPVAPPRRRAACCRRSPRPASRLTGSSEPLAPAAFVAALERELEALAADGGYLAIVLHPFMLDWLEAANLGRLLDRLAALAAAGRIELLRCADAAERVRAEAERFAGGTVLDPTSWA